MRSFLGKSEALVLGVSTWVVITCNSGFWRTLYSSGAGGTPQALPHLASFFFVAVGLTSLVLLVLAVGRATRPVLLFALVVAVVAGYFTAHYGVLIDKKMLVNVFETDTAEAAELITFRFLATILVVGILPGLVILRMRLPRRRPGQAILQRAFALAISVALVGGSIFLDQKEIFSTGRNHRELAHMIAPLDVFVASYALLGDELAPAPEFESLATDATVALPATDPDKPNVHVLIVGETARAASFALTGYSRDTTPGLARHALYSVREVTACGTATAQSVPCMFSIQTADDFDSRRARYQDNLLDIAARAGYDVRWIDNGNNCKGVCSRVENVDLAATGTEPDCQGERCYDEVLLKELRRVLPTIHRNTLLVLHQLGSHGPAYFRRYPEEFRQFVPDCRSEDFSACTVEEITNSYDNTILYTDYVVSQAIDALAAESDRLTTSLLYVSDHGESLGEHNLYLHGMPRQFAPIEQTQVPLVAWFSKPAILRQGLAARCEDARPDQPASHDNLFHTELGVLGIRSTVYRPELDLFAPCRAPIHAGVPEPTPSTAG